MLSSGGMSSLADMLKKAARTTVKQGKPGSKKRRAARKVERQNRKKGRR